MTPLDFHLLKSPVLDEHDVGRRESCEDMDARFPRMRLHACVNRPLRDILRRRLLLNVRPEEIQTGDILLRYPYRRHINLIWGVARCPCFICPERPAYHPWKTYLARPNGHAVFGLIDTVDVLRLNKHDKYKKMPRWMPR